MHDDHHNPSPPLQELVKLVDANLPQVIYDPSKSARLRHRVACDAFVLVDGKIIVDEDWAMRSPAVGEITDTDENEFRKMLGLPVMSDQVVVNCHKVIIAEMLGRNLTVGRSSLADPDLTDQRIIIDPLVEGQPQVIDLDTRDTPTPMDEAITKEEFEELKCKFMVNHLIHLINILHRDEGKADAFIKKVHRAGILLSGEDASETPDYIPANPALNTKTDNELHIMTGYSPGYYGRYELNEADMAAAQAELERRNSIKYLREVGQNIPVGLYVANSGNTPAGVISGDKVFVYVWAHGRHYYNLPDSLSRKNLGWGEQFDPPALAALVGRICGRDMIVRIDASGMHSHGGIYWSNASKEAKGSHIDSDVKPSNYTSDELARIERALIRMTGDRVRKEMMAIRSIIAIEFRNLGVFNDADLQSYIHEYGAQ